MKNLRLVKVEWADANGGWRHGWKEIADMPKNMETATAVSVGYVIHENKIAILLCPHLVSDRAAPDKDLEGDGEIAIPKAWVTRIVDLVEEVPTS